jgi:predicted Zn-dependent protease
MNRLDESVEEAKMAIALDPASRPWGLGYALFLTHHFDAAVVELQHRSAARPTDVALHYVLRGAYQSKGMLKESVAELVEALRLEADHESEAEVNAAFEKEGHQGVAKWQSHRLQREEAKTGYISSERFAETYADLRDQELTLRYLQLAYQERSPQMVRVHLNPCFDFLHSDPRFQSLVKKIGLSTAF